MGTLIDTSVLIAVENGGLDLDQVSAANGDNAIALSAVSASELLHGVDRTQTSAQRHRREAFVEGIITRFPVIAFDLSVARVHASLWANLAKRGVSVGERDLMIGATAMAIGFSVATRDKRSFARIPGLAVQLI